MPQKELLQAGFSGLKRTYDRVLTTMTPKELAWQPQHDANSIQIILLHMARAEDTNIQQRLQKKTEIWETGKWYEKLGKDIKDNGGHYTPEQVAAFTVTDVKELLAYSEAVRANSLEYLKGLSEQDLEKKITIPAFGPPAAPGQPPRPPQELTVAQMFFNTVTHLAMHNGDIGYIRGLVRGMDK